MKKYIVLTTFICHLFECRSLPYIKSIPTGLGQTEICFPKTCGYTAEAIRAQMNEIIQLLQVFPETYSELKFIINFYLYVNVHVAMSEDTVSISCF